MSTSIPVIGTTNGLIPNDIILSVPDTVISVMYNKYDNTLYNESIDLLNTSSENKCNLNVFNTNYTISGSSSITFSNFLDLFYNTNAGYFNVNPSNSNSSYIVLSEQTYQNINNLTTKFSLYQYLLQSYSSNMNISVNDIDPRILILLQKETFATQSLAFLKGTTIGMTWTEVMNLLVSSNLIQVQESASVTVPLSIILKYHSYVLNIDVSIKFTFLVPIPNYSVVNTPIQP